MLSILSDENTSPSGESADWPVDTCVKQTLSLLSACVTFSWSIFQRSNGDKNSWKWSMLIRIILKSSSVIWWIPSTYTRLIFPPRPDVELWGSDPSSGLKVPPIRCSPINSPFQSETPVSHLVSSAGVRTDFHWRLTPSASLIKSTPQRRWNNSFNNSELK